MNKSDLKAFRLSLIGLTELSPIDDSKICGYCKAYIYPRWGYDEHTAHCPWSSAKAILKAINFKMTEKEKKWICKVKELQNG